MLDRTVFYPEGGGQPGDTGRLALPGGGETAIDDTRKDRETGEHRHIPADGAALPAAGDAVTCAIDWDRRYRHMRVHTAMHLMCAVIVGDGHRRPGRRRQGQAGFRPAGHRPSTRPPSGLRSTR